MIIIRLRIKDIWLTETELAKKLPAATDQESALFSGLDLAEHSYLTALK